MFPNKYSTDPYGEEAGITATYEAAQAKLAQLDKTREHEAVFRAASVAAANSPHERLVPIDSRYLRGAQSATTSRNERIAAASPLSDRFPQTLAETFAASVTPDMRTMAGRYPNSQLAEVVRKRDAFVDQTKLALDPESRAVPKPAGTLATQVAEGFVGHYYVSEPSPDGQVDWLAYTGGKPGNSEISGDLLFGKANQDIKDALDASGYTPLEGMQRDLAPLETLGLQRPEGYSSFTQQNQELFAALRAQELGNSAVQGQVQQ